MTFYADIFFNPHIKPGVVLAFYSKQGAGKDIINEILMKALLGICYGFTNNVQELTKNFNWKFANKLLIKVNELGSQATYLIMEQLKALITDECGEFEKKFCDGVTLKHFSRYIMHTNNPDAIRLERGARRFACFECNNDKIGDREYFDALGKTVNDPITQAHFFTFLLNFKPKNIDGTDVPKINLRNIPETSWKQELTVHSSTGLTRFLFLIAQEALDFPDQGFPFSRKEDSAQYFSKSLHQDYNHQDYNFVGNQTIFYKHSESTDFQEILSLAFYDTYLANEPNVYQRSHATRSSIKKALSEFGIESHPARGNIGGQNRPTCYRLPCPSELLKILKN